MNPTVSGALQSKTIWFNVLSAIAALVQTVSPILPPQYVPVVAAVLAGVNVGLRSVTSVSLADKGAKQP